MTKIWPEPEMETGHDQLFRIRFAPASHTTNRGSQWERVFVREGRLATYKRHRGNREQHRSFRSETITYNTIKMMTKFLVSPRERSMRVRALRVTLHIIVLARKIQYRQILNLTLDSLLIIILRIISATCLNLNIYINISHTHNYILY